MSSTVGNELTSWAIASILSKFATTNSLPPAEALPEEIQRNEQERQRGDRLAAKLRELNIDPDSI